jgi:hypothetical protein
MSDSRNGIETLRHAVKVLNDCNETFNQRYTATELLELVRIAGLSKWDFYPDQWSARQIREALDFGTVPDWNDDETPRYNRSPEDEATFMVAAQAAKAADHLHSLRTPYVEAIKAVRNHNGWLLTEARAWVDEHMSELDGKVSK